MAITHSVQATANANRNTSNPTISITPVSGDDFLILVVYVDDTTEGDISSITDSQSNTWNLGHSATNGNQKTNVYYVIAPVIGATTVTVNTTASTDTVLTCNSYSGVKQTSPVGIIVTQAQNTANVLLSMSTLTVGSLVIAGGGQDTNSTVSAIGTGQTNRGEIAQGGAEKFMGVTTDEVTASISNSQTMTLSKTGNVNFVGIEFFAEPSTGFAHSQGVIIA